VGYNRGRVKALGAEKNFGWSGVWCFDVLSSYIVVRDILVNIDVVALLFIHRTVKVIVDLVNEYG